jgi:DNA-binding protein YbaB
VVRVEISPDFFEGEPDSDDLEMLGDTVVAAINDAMEKARAKQAEALGPLAGGLPGM